MHYISKPLQEFLHTYTLPNPTTQSLNTFKEHLDHFLAQCHKHTAQDTSESEEFQKNLIADFLKQAFSYPKINTKHKIDLAIYEDDEVKTFFEVKSIANKSEFPKSTQSLDSKALYEALLYYMREQNEGNNNLKCILLCNVESFYLINAKEFEKLSQNKELQKAYKNVDKKQGNDTSTKKFYQKAQEILSTLDMEMTFTHFGIKDTEPVLLYQVFSPHLLLGYKTHIDSNVLNQNFYEELLYILGLEETKDGANKLIKLSDTPNTLSYAIRENLGLDCVRDFESIFELIITWNNRLLFLRLLESMLLSFKHIPKPFLDSSVIESFAKLNTLFFEILALRENVRKSIPKELDSIPYLNSSLFDKTELEKQGKEIKLLDSKPLALYKKSILKDTKKPLPLLEYLFDFLNAYDFTTTPKDIQDNVKINHDKLINAAVLGLVFEKLNGYKEGSFYTPSFITNYMCKQSLQQVVIQKFNTAKNWDCKDLQSLKLRLDKLTDSPDGYKEANEIFDSIKVCDPAVGSGHFLVSMLNNMIELKFHLKILCDENFERLKDIQLRLENDEIVLQDSTGNPHIYQIPSHQNIESHKLQKAIFHNKRTLIESCLFGVDINHNSCEITKLRLWIELLKYSYYIFENGKNTNTLQTLPNIDINIKCGNSLISYFDITHSLSHYPNINTKIKDYKQAVQNYKEGLYQDKQALDSKIKELHTAFKNFCFKDKFKSQIKAFEKECDKYSAQYGNYLAKDDENLSLYVKASLSIFDDDFDKKQAQIDFATLQESYNALFNLESNKPFEWRFAFPEVLDNNGDFLGFDLVIGNPPYIKEADNKELFTNTKKLRTYQGKMDIWYHFVGRGFDILKKNGFLSFIATNNWTTNSGAKKLRNIILQESQILSLIDFTSFKVFDSASIQTMIMQFQKTKPPKKYKFHFAKITSPKPTYEDLQDILNNRESPNNEILEINFSPKDFIDKTLNFTKNDYEELFNKIQQYGNFHFEENEVAQGIVYPQENVNKKSLEILGKGFYIGQGIQKLTEDELNQLQLLEFEKNLLKPIYESNDIKKYFVEKNNNFWVIYTDSSFKKPNSMDNYPNLKKHLDKFKEVITSDNKPYGLHRARDEKFFTGSPRIIALRKCVDEPKFSYVDFDCYVSATFYIIKTQRIDSKYLTAILNSKLIAFWLKHKGKMQGNNYQIDKEPLLNIPIPKIDSTNKALSDEIISLVEQILDSKAKDPTTDTKELESKIDSLVYKLYNLTESEIKIIEGK
ncbi:Eco57I restriction-modification methylase domain-containing protein [Helicobacter sp. 14348-15]|uniref:type IIG restriction enzyme/methyltransferase n=1 Tax=Helicobacter colisuis TaxID=2949739 RepID=UPI00202B6356|nr:Eco57I restriction-modification methylase domain-containing protein [Helicobacter colisuis]MCL9820317.1 Eco57I restriction-modification methylase domain-containing protein [Helicobacter colisuis]